MITIRFRLGISLIISSHSSLPLLLGSGLVLNGVNLKENGGQISCVNGTHCAIQCRLNYSALNRGGHVVPGIVSEKSCLRDILTRFRNLPEERDSARNHQFIDEESTRGRGNHQLIDADSAQ
jgi:hypothetical protein